MDELELSLNIFIIATRDELTPGIRGHVTFKFDFGAEVIAVLHRQCELISLVLFAFHCHRLLQLQQA